MLFFNFQFAGKNLILAMNILSSMHLYDSRLSNHLSCSLEYILYYIILLQEPNLTNIIGFSRV